MTLYHALIRTHHITSRKKVATLKAAAKKLEISVLLRSGGVPGLMYVHGRSLENIQGWVNKVHELRYKEYQLVAPTAEMPKHTEADAGANDIGTFEEVESVRDMAAAMERRALLEWWRKAMGYVND